VGNIMTINMWGLLSFVAVGMLTFFVLAAPILYVGLNREASASPAAPQPRLLSIAILGIGGLAVLAMFAVWSSAQLSDQPFIKTVPAPAKVPADRPQQGPIEIPLPLQREGWQLVTSTKLPTAVLSSSTVTLSLPATQGLGQYIGLSIREPGEEISIYAAYIKQSDGNAKRLSTPYTLSAGEPRVVYIGSDRPAEKLVLTYFTLGFPRSLTLDVFRVSSVDGHRPVGPSGR
jgi:hypothetical protein